MTGGHDLTALLRGMDPVMHQQTYVFATMKGAIPTGISPRMTFQEAEGTTLILTQDEAETAQMAYEFPCRMITLNIHSALDAVGFLARVSTRLAALNMGVNPVAGFYHDHLFVPEARAEQAMDALRQMAAEASAP